MEHTINFHLKRQWLSQFCSFLNCRQVKIKLQHTKVVKSTEREWKTQQFCLKFPPGSRWKQVWLTLLYLLLRELEKPVNSSYPCTLILPSIIWIFATCQIKRTDVSLILLNRIILFFIDSFVPEESEKGLKLVPEWKKDWVEK